MSKTKGSLRDFLEMKVLTLGEDGPKAVTLGKRVKAKADAEFIEKLLAEYDAA
jgi:hypothetical protein